MCIGLSVGCFRSLGLLVVLGNDAQVLVESGGRPGRLVALAVLGVLCGLHDSRNVRRVQVVQVVLCVQASQAFGGRRLQMLITEATVCLARIRLEIEFYVLLVQGLVVIELVEAFVFFETPLAILIRRILIQLLALYKTFLFKIIL